MDPVDEHGRSIDPATLGVVTRWDQLHRRGSPLRVTHPTVIDARRRVERPRHRSGDRTAPVHGPSRAPLWHGRLAEPSRPHVGLIIHAPIAARRSTSTYATAGLTSCARPRRRPGSEATWPVPAVSARPAGFLRRAGSRCRASRRGPRPGRGVHGCRFQVAGRPRRVHRPRRAARGRRRGSWRSGARARLPRILRTFVSPSAAAKCAVDSTTSAGVRRARRPPSPVGGSAQRGLEARLRARGRAAASRPLPPDDAREPGRHTQARRGLGQRARLLAGFARRQPPRRSSVGAGACARPGSGTLEEGLLCGAARSAC